MPVLEAPSAAPDPERRNPEIVRLMKRINRHHCLRDVIDAQTGHVQNTPETVPILLATITKTAEFAWRERLTAVLAIKKAEVSPEDSYAVATALGSLLNNTDFGRFIDRSFIAAWRMVEWVVFAILLSPFLMLLLSSCLQPGEDMEIRYVLLYAMFGLTPFILLLSPWHDRTRAGWVKAATVDALAHLKLPESAAALAKAARGTSSRAARAYSALREVLPTLTPKLYGQLPADTTPELCALLESGRWDSYEAFTGTPMKEMLLHALGKVGDGRAVLPVERFARSANSSELREQAERILPILQERAEQAKNAGILLRGSSAPEAKPVELLRAASYVTTTEPDQLLRATLGPKSDSCEPNA